MAYLIGEARIDGLDASCSTVRTVDCICQRLCDRFIKPHNRIDCG
jgi:hypothetical protein